MAALQPELPSSVVVVIGTLSLGHDLQAQAFHIPVGLSPAHANRLFQDPIVFRFSRLRKPWVWVVPPVTPSLTAVVC